MKKCFAFMATSQVADACCAGAYLARGDNSVTLGTLCWAVWKDLLVPRLFNARQPPALRRVYDEDMGPVVPPPEQPFTPPAFACPKCGAQTFIVRPGQPVVVECLKCGAVSPFLTAGSFTTTTD